jgi:tetratricopeptide (TPR) repeat protein
MHQGGRHWQEFLSIPGRAYTEIQAGLAPTQRHSLPFEAGGQRWWTEVFGYIRADSAKVHGADWETAWREVDNTLKTRLTAYDLAEIEGKCLRQADNVGHELLQTGSGWGALELARRSAQKNGYALPATFVFPAATLGHEQKKWLHLLEKGCLPEQPAEPIPGDWIVQRHWRELLGKSLEVGQNRNWYALLHYGVMQAEVFNDSAASAAWEESLAKTPSIWAYRNLAVMARAAGKTAEALDWYQKAWQLAMATQQIQASFAQEYLSLLSEAGEFQKAWNVSKSLPAQALDFDAVQILRASIALQVGCLDEAELALQREYASVREGAVILTDLWIELWRRKMSAETGRPAVEISTQEIEAAHPPPAGIDFRSAQ